MWRAIVREFCIQDSPGLSVLRVGLEAHARMRQAQGEVLRDGLTFKAGTGAIRPHPAIAVERDCRDAWLRCVKQLGFSVEPIGAVGRPAGAHLPKQF